MYLPYKHNVAALKLWCAFGALAGATLAGGLVYNTDPDLLKWGVIAYAVTFVCVAALMNSIFKTFKQHSELAGELQAVLRSMCHQSQKLTPEGAVIEQYAFAKLFPLMLDKPELFEQFWQEDTSTPSRARFAKFLQLRIKQVQDQYAERGLVTENDREYRSFLEHCARVDALVRRNGGCLEVYDILGETPASLRPFGSTS